MVKDRLQRRFYWGYLLLVIVLVNHRQHEIGGLQLFVGFWPLAYKVSQKVRPASVFVMAVGYYYAYKNLIVPFGTQRLQDNLNNVAKPFAEKYGVTIA